MTDAPPDAVQAGLKGLCPRCGKGRLFQGLLSFAPACSNCGLDFRAFNVGDGPAAFLTLVIGAIVVGLAMWLEFGVHPPWWVHALLWVPLVIIGTIGSLRLAKGVLLALEYRHKAVEGRLDDRQP